MKSENWKCWDAKDDDKTCYGCSSRDGKIYGILEKVNPSPPLHLYCRCMIRRLDAVFAGTATKTGDDGIDWFLMKKGQIPDYYISKNDAKKLGWNSKKGNLAEVAPGKMILGGVYYNDDGHLPSKPGRRWYEADINYESGRRNAERVLFSNDGLVFVTYDHYNTFIEIIS